MGKPRTRADRGPEDILLGYVRFMCGATGLLYLRCSVADGQLFARLALWEGRRGTDRSEMAAASGCGRRAGAGRVVDSLPGARAGGHLGSAGNAALPLCAR